MIYFAFLFNTFLFTWYSAKLLRDVSGIDQYWHIPQMLMLYGFFLMPLLVAKNKIQYLIRLICFSLTFPFLFNSGLNLYRDLPINHLGKYDFLSFEQAIALFCVGLLMCGVCEISFSWIVNKFDLSGHHTPYSKSDKRVWSSYRCVCFSLWYLAFIYTIILLIAWGLLFEVFYLLWINLLKK